MLGRTPITRGCCIFSPSVKNPTTQAPSTIPVADCPIDPVPAELIGNITLANGKSSVGNAFLSSV